jgi:hypothetical protein
VDYVRILESRDGIDDDPEGAGQLLGAQVDGTTTWNEMYGVCYEDSCILYARDTIRPERAVMHANVSLECECDVFCNYMRLLIVCS